MPKFEAVNVTEQLATPGDTGASIHEVDEKVPGRPLAVNDTIPVGVRTVPAVDVSVTVTTHVVAWPNLTGDVQLTDVLVVRGFTVTLVVPLLAVNWFTTPG